MARAAATACTPAAHGSAAVLYLRQRDLAFTRARPAAKRRPARRATTACKASCVDWYGNARPIFLGDRVFALLGYELVEGQLAGERWQERIEERRRISFAPNAAARLGRYSPFNSDVIATGASRRRAGALVRIVRRRLSASRRGDRSAQYRPDNNAPAFGATVFNPSVCSI